MALVVVVTIKGYPASWGFGSSNASSGQTGGDNPGGLPTTTVRLDCPVDGDVDGEPVIPDNHIREFGDCHCPKGGCALDSDGDGRQTDLRPSNLLALIIGPARGESGPVA